MAMTLRSDSFQDGQPLDDRLAFCKPDAETHATFSDNRNPHLAWEGAPEGTKSFVLLCHDPDVPSKPDDVNQEGREVPSDLPRVDFYHWILVDLGAGTTELAEGAFSSAVTPKGKPGPEGPGGTRQGVNNYKDWFGDDPDMGGDYHGYDGPCPPWNDSIVHHYHFTVYATDLDALPADVELRGPAVAAALEGHVLDQASLVGTFTLNSRLRA